MIYSIPKIENRLKDNEKNIVGMIFVELNGRQGELNKYKIQQSNDPHSYVELVFNISPL